ncbi:hypothetical protein EDC22_1274 [Tepidamorphus gemmatus]|uniref:Uncharacterized protein n=1 Tax=Tepidamorphus gemmatus TaxID=747076 RepID=A0A4R3LVA2_9HYPH|nr:hypothetical protein EDC22_1274 [Tepidamorphus gemmatus]
MISWLLSLPWVRRLGLWIGAVVAAVAAIAAIRRSGERAGRLEERLNQQKEIADAERRMLDASRDRPRDRDDLARRLRDGSF